MSKDKQLVEIKNIQIYSRGIDRSIKMEADRVLAQGEALAEMFSSEN
jgi:hypothetical protein